MTTANPLGGIMSAAQNFAETGGWLTPEGGDPRLPQTTPLQTSVGQALDEVPFGQMLLSMMKAVGNAQFQLDLGAAKVAQLMAGLEVDGLAIGNGGRFRIGVMPGQPDSGADVTLLELGFAPTFYQFEEVELDVKVTMKMRQEVIDSRTALEVAASGSASGFGASGPSYDSKNLATNAKQSFLNLGSGTDTWKNVLGWGPSHKVSLNVSMVNTKTTSKYGMSAEGSASVSAVMAPTPPPEQLMSRLQELLQSQAPQTVVSVPELNGMTWSDARDALGADVEMILADGVSIGDSQVIVDYVPKDFVDRTHGTVWITEVGPSA